MPSADTVSSNDVREKGVVAAESTEQLLPSNGDMSQFGDIVKTQPGAATPLLPEFHIDTTNIYAPPVFERPEQVDCSRYDTVAANPVDDQVVKDLTNAELDGNMAKANVAFQGYYNQKTFDSFHQDVDGPLSISGESYLDLNDLVTEFKDRPILTIPQYHGAQFIANNFDLLKSEDGLVHQDGLNKWVDSTMREIDLAVWAYRDDVLACLEPEANPKQ
jgi:hypothetical protein